MNDLPPVIEEVRRRKFPHRIIWPGLLALILFNAWLIWFTTRRPNPTLTTSTPAYVVPLTAAYNGQVTESTTVRDKNDNPNTLAEFPLGENEFAGVRFHVDGILQLNGRYPDRVEGIDLGRPCRRLHLLAGTAGKSPDGTIIATLALNYASGQRIELPIKYGEHVRDWWQRPRDPAPQPPLRVAWTGENVLTRREEADLNVYLATFENPRPAAIIQSIDLLSANTASWPFFLGLSTE
jgi:hypothetical protein